MKQYTSLLSAALITTLISSTFSQQTLARDFFFTLGGGYSPSGNQISLEKNILYFKRALKDMGLDTAPHHILFADGTNKGRDLQFADPKLKAPEANFLLASLMGSTRGLKNNYRSSVIPGVNGPSDHNHIDKYFNDIRKKLTPGDRLMFYFTGHGGSTVKKGTQNTKVYLWDRKNMTVTDMVKRLDRLPKHSPVVLIMVQCYSGGFANVIFKDGDPRKGLSDHPRAGFYATVFSRVAAGCTPDINEANYQEYSTFFWAALYGKTRLGKPVKAPDFNRDGIVSFSEAHAYALIESDTIDISIKTSDAFLRTFSKTKLTSSKSKPRPKTRPAPRRKTTPAKPKTTKTTIATEVVKGCLADTPPAAADNVKQKAINAGKAAIKAAKQPAPPKPKLNLMTADSDYNLLLAAAGPNEKAVLQGLSKSLRLKDPVKRTAEVRKLISKISADRKKLRSEKSMHSRNAGTHKKALQKIIRANWPEASNAYHPVTVRLLTTDSKKFLATLKKSRNYKPYISAAKKAGEVTKRDRDLERKWIKCQRFLHVAENIALAVNLPKLVKDKKILDRYQALLKLENGTIQPRRVTHIGR